MANEDQIDSAETTEELYATPEAPEGGEGEQQEAIQPAGDDEVVEGAEGGEGGAQTQQQAHHIPLAVHLTEREARQAAERRAEEAERRWNEFQSQQRRQEEQPQRPDLYGDPDQVFAYFDRQVEQRMAAYQQQQEDRLIEATFEAARQKNAEQFDKAFAAVRQAPPQVHAAIRGSFNPGETLMQWWANETAMQEIGGDLNGYKKRYREELMKDPEFRKSFMASLEAEARGERSNVTTLPSAGRAPGGAHKGDAEELSTDELYAPARR